MTRGLLQGGGDGAWALGAYCGPAPQRDTLLLHWNFDPLLILGLLVLAGIHLMLRARGGPRGEDAAFTGGWLVLVIAFVSPLCALSVALFSARAAHHLMMVALAAPLIAWAWRARFSALVTGERSALVWLVPTALHIGLFWFWHAPDPYGAALQWVPLYWLMQGSLGLSALLFWGVVMAPRPSHGPAEVLAITTAMSLMGLLGALLTFAGSPLYGPHLLTTEAFGLGALEDQQLAGLLMWVPGALPYLIAAVVTGARCLRERLDGAPQEQPQ